MLLSASRVGPTGRAIGLDMTDEMLALAQRNAAEAGATNVEFLKGQIEAIPLPAELDRRRDQQLRDQPRRRQAGRLPRDRPRPPARRPDRHHRHRRRRRAQPAEQRAERGSYVGCIAGALSFGEYEAGLRGRRDSRTSRSRRPTRKPAGMTSAIIRARKSDAAIEATSAGSTLVVRLLLADRSAQVFSIAGQRKTALVLVLAAASWGLGTVLSKYALDEVAPLTLLPIQLAASVLVLTILVYRNGVPKDARRTSPILGRLGILKSRTGLHIHPARSRVDLGQPRGPDRGDRAGHDPRPRDGVPARTRHPNDGRAVGLRARRHIGRGLRPDELRAGDRDRPGLHRSRVLRRVHGHRQALDRDRRTRPSEWWPSSRRMHCASRSSSSVSSR